MKRHIKNRTYQSLAALVLVALCGSARADISGSAFSTTLTAWPSEPSSNPQQPFYTTSLTGLGGDGMPGAATGATAITLGETFTITNGAGAAFGAGPGTGTNYVLTGIGLVLSGYSSSVPVTLHLLDVTANLTSTSGGIYNGSGASFTQTSPTMIGDLFGEGAGLQFFNNVNSGAEAIRYLSLQNGPNTYGDQVILASNHTYCLEFAVPASNPNIVYAFRQFSSPDPGGEGMQTGNLTPTNAVTTPGYSGTFALALYGYPATNAQAVSVNSSTNSQVYTNYWIDQFNALSVVPGNPYYTNTAYPNGIDFSTSDPATNNASATGGIADLWINWFGLAPTVTWDNTQDAQGNTNGGLGGSMLIQTTFVGNDQFEVMDGYGGISPALDGSALGITSFECDVMFDSSSAVQTNYNNGVPGLVYFGNLQFGTRTAPGYGQDYFGNGADTQVPQTMSNQWVHVKIPISAISDPQLSDIVMVMVHIYGPYGNGGVFSQSLLGDCKFWVDNIKFKAPLALPLIPPPTLKIAPATPGTARFFSTGPQYTRTELATVDTAQSWIGGPGDTGNISTPYTLPVSYSFTLSRVSTDPNVQTHLFLVPNVAGTYNGVDYTSASELWLQLVGFGANGVTANVAFKANTTGGANPTNTMLRVTNALGVGTWTLTFTGQTNGMLMAPGWLTASNFTIPDPDVATDFANPVTAFFGIQGNGSVYGAYDDYTRISVTNVAGVNELDVFANDTNIDTTLWSEAFDIGTPTGYYQITNAAAMGGAGFTSAYPATINPIFVVTPSTPFWVTWNVTTNGYGLAESTTLPISNSLISPASFSGYTNVQLQCIAGTTNWALIPKECLAPGNQGYFEVVNPPPQN